MGFWREYTEVVAKYSVGGIAAGAICATVADAATAPEGQRWETTLRRMVKVHIPYGVRYWGVPTLAYGFIILNEVEKTRQKYEQKQGKEGSETPVLG